MKKLLSITVSLILMAIALCAVSFIAYAEDFDEKLEENVVLTVNTDFKDGTAATTDALSVDMTTADGTTPFPASDITFTVKKGASSDEAESFDRANNVYSVTCSFRIKQGDEYRYLDENVKPAIILNGSTLGKSSVIIEDEIVFDEGTDHQVNTGKYRGVSFTIYFYNISYNTGEFIGFFNTGAKVEVSAKTAPEGQYFRRWSVVYREGEPQNGEFDYPTSENAVMTVDKAAKIIVTPVYANILYADIDGTFAIGTTPSFRDVKITGKNGYTAIVNSLIYRDANGNPTIYKLADDVPFYTMVFNVSFNKDGTPEGVNAKYVRFTVNGVEIPTSAVVKTDENSVNVSVKFNNVTLDGKECLGFYNEGMRIKISAPSVSGKHFVKWSGTYSHPKKDIAFENAKSAVTYFTVGDKRNSLETSYENHNFGNNLKVCSVCGAANPDYKEPEKPTDKTTPTPAPSAKTVKKANPMTVKVKKLKVSLKKLKKKKKLKFSVKKALDIKNAQGKLTYKKVKGSKKIKVSKKTGKITVKKGLKKKTYTIKIKVTAAGNSIYKAKSKTVKVKIKVK